MAACWAAKEAVLRSMGTTWRKGLAWTDVEILCDNPNNPTVILSGSIKQMSANKQIQAIQLAMAHCRAFATATALAHGG